MRVGPTTLDQAAACLENYILAEKAANKPECRPPPPPGARGLENKSSPDPSLLRRYTPSTNKPPLPFFKPKCGPYTFAVTLCYDGTSIPTRRARVGGVKTNTLQYGKVTQSLLFLWADGTPTIRLSFNGMRHGMGDTPSRSYADRKDASADSTDKIRTKVCDSSNIYRQFCFTGKSSPYSRLASCREVCRHGQRI